VHFFRDVATTTSPAEGLLLLFQDALELLSEFHKRDVQARQQSDDRIERGIAHPALQAGQIPSVRRPDPAPAAPGRVQLEFFEEPHAYKTSKLPTTVILQGEEGLVLAPPSLGDRPRFRIYSLSQVSDPPLKSFG
jgi:hypothetical protein